MNFFTAQEQARKRTKWLILWFALGVLGTVACLYALAIVLTQWHLVSDPSQLKWSGNSVAMATAVGAMVIIPLGSAFKLMQLSQGGAVVARDMGARRVDRSSMEFAERQLLNVVEEMAIASGIPVPQVWVMDNEPSINAFAAGTEPSNAVVAVSRGCLEKLTRSELQGVVAHEFSHILNGDMRLNMRLIGWLFGLLMIAMLGRGMLSILRHVRVRDSGDSKSYPGLILVLVLTGACLWLVGSLGAFFGRIIQSAVSRQREFLADASAVQFTRDPSGIAGALKKIARLPQQRVFAPKATEAAHLFFSGAVGYFFPNLLATHPPLVQRILAIDPNWDGDLRKAEEPSKAPVRPTWENHSRSPVVSAFSAVGEMSVIDVPAAAVLRESMQEFGSISSVAEAKGFLLALVSSGERVVAPAPDGRLDASEQSALDHWHAQCLPMSSAQKIAWMDVALPVMRQMSLAEYREFRETLQVWVARDQKITLFEWMIHHAIERHLHVCFERTDVTPMKWHHMAQVEEALAKLFACLCSLSDDASTWSRFVAEYQQRNGRVLAPVTADFTGLNEALQTLDAASPTLKRQILELGLWVTQSDQVVNDPEIELLRATADAMGAVLPPQSLC
jgi:Zn-dependent protease with chaperone function